MIGRTLKMAFWVTYDHLGKLLAAGFLWSAAVGLLAYLGFLAAGSPYPYVRFGLGLPLLALAGPIALAVGAAAVAELAKELIETRDGSLDTFFAGIRRYGFKAAQIGGIYSAAGICLVTSAWFYPAVLGASIPLAGYVLGALATWAIVFAAMTALYVMPALVHKRSGVGPTMRLAVALVLDNPVLTFGLLVQCLLWTVFCALIPPVAVLLYGPVIVVLASSAYEMLSRKYSAEATPDEAQDDYLNRGMRDFFFPWRG